MQTSPLIASPSNQPSIVQNSPFSIKWLDVALFAGVTALLIIGILASENLFNNWMGTTNAEYLAFGSWGGAALLLSAAVVKLAVQCCKQQPIERSDRGNQNKPLEHPIEEEITLPIPKNTSFETKDPLSQKEIEQLKKNALGFFPEHEPQLSGNKDLLDYNLNIINSPLFQKNPVAFMHKWAEQRGHTEEYRFPEDRAEGFFFSELRKIRNLPYSY